jgi:tetratricopeptide (TPR) repeat protein
MGDHSFRALAAACILLAGVVAYANTLDGDWVWDDASSVLLHAHVQDPSKFFQLFAEDQHAFGRGQGNFYRPLVSVTFMADYLVTGLFEAPPGPEDSPTDLAPLVFHISNMIWHILAALLLFTLLSRLKAPQFAALGTALIFVLHPLHTEAVAYISGRADMMSAVFILAGLCAVAANAGWLAAIGGAVSFALGLLSKESSLIFPGLLALMLLLQPGAVSAAPVRVRLLKLLPALAVLVGYIALRATVLRFATPEAAVSAPLGQRLIETCQAFAFYWKVLLWPTHLHMEQTLAGTPLWTAGLGALLLVLVIGTGVVARRAGQRRIAFAIAWFLLTWLPISGIFPLNAPMAEHWMYVPMMGFWWAVTEIACLRGGERWERARKILAYAACLAFLSLTVQRNEDWDNNTRLFRSTLAENPASMRVHFNLAVTYQDLEKNLPGARRHYESVIALAAQEKARLGLPAEQLLDQEIEAQLGLGQVLLEQGQMLQATMAFRKLLPLARAEAYRGVVSAAFLGLGECFLADGDVAAANAHFTQAMKLEPGHGPAIEALITGKPRTNS